MTRVTRRAMIQSAAAGASVALLHGSHAAAADRPADVPWLEEIQRPPEKLPEGAPKLTDLSRDAGGRPIDSRQAWERRREELRGWWLEFLGPLPAERKSPPKLEVVAEDKPHGVVRQLVRYEAEPGLVTEAYLLRPEKLDGKAPG